MQQIRLIHWNSDEAHERATRLAALGYQVNHELPNPPAFVKELAADPPAAVVIDLSRLPSQGRDLAVLIRGRKGTRTIPLVFVGGEPEKVARTRELLPDATYTAWEVIENALAEAISHPPAQPAAPGSAFAAYAGQPLAGKLGIKPGLDLCLVDAPEGFEAKLDVLPAESQVRRAIGDGCALTLWFVRSQAELVARIGKMAAEFGDVALWIAWPKKASGQTTDLTQQMVRETGLAAGLVDYKICSIDEMWSALLFTRRSYSRARA